MANIGDQLKNPENGWKRILCSDSSKFNYSPLWAMYNEPNSSCKYVFYVDTVDQYVTFKFYGNSFRIIGINWESSSNKIGVSIDGKSEEYFSEQTSLAYDILCYEKTNLELKEHTVKIRNAVNGLRVHFNAIDIPNNSNNYFLSPDRNIGNQISSPDTNWKRISGLDNLIRRNDGVFEEVPDENCTNKKYVHTTGNGANFHFKFYGTKLRIISIFNSETSSTRIKINIDNNEFNVSNYNKDITVYKALLFQKLDLNEGEHECVITNITSSGYNLFIDSIDINSDGYLIDSTFKVGDILKSNYVQNGYKRIFYDNSNFIYNGNGFSTSDFSIVKGSIKTLTCITNYIKFKFTGSKLKIIGAICDNATSCSVKIDNVSYGNIEEYKVSTYNRQGVYDPVVFIKENLDNSEHICIIEYSSTTGRAFFFEGIEIDSTGNLLYCERTQNDILDLKKIENGWKRIDNTYKEFNFSPIENWDNYTSDSNFFNTSVQRTTTIGSYFTFNFKGTKFRIIGFKNPDCTRSVDVYLDGNKIGNYSTYNKYDTWYRTIDFEKLNLENKKHTVKIINNVSNKYLHIDSIEIDSDGEILPPNREIGEQLLKPDTGWKRIDDTESTIIYSGKWDYAGANLTSDAANYYNSSFHLTRNTSARIKFKFYGDRIRLIFIRNRDCSNSCYIKIDGTEYKFSNYYATIQYQRLVFQKDNLLNGFHDIEIRSATSNAFGLDAIDLVENGFLLTDDMYNYMNSNLKSGDITINRILKTNLPKSVEEKIGLYFTEDKGLYINNNDGALVNINHNHTNENVLDLISADDNNLLFNGNIIDVDDPALTDEDKSNIIANIFSASGSDSIIHGTYGMQYISESKKDQYELALKICEDNSDFYYSSAYWTNDTLLNENDYTDMTKNSKYECFINKPVKDILFVLNNVKMHVHLDKQYNSLKELFTKGGTASCEEYILNDTKSLFGYDRDVEIYNTGFLINYIWNTEKSAVGGGVRIGFTINNIKNNTNDLPGSFEGLGIFSNSDSTGRNEKQSCNSGRTAWCLPKQFSKAFIYIK